ncbi:MAG: 50S ribosomal protein L7ae [Synergistaceae bacterium]|nr:50S ribosomal protein L7ae [Synergistaceae bacterium]
MPLQELATEARIAGRNAVLRKLKAGGLAKIFLSEEADVKFANEILRGAERASVPVEMVAQSLQLGRACALSRKTAVAALLKN